MKEGRKKRREREGEKGGEEKRVREEGKDLNSNPIIMECQFSVFGT